MVNTLGNAAIGRMVMNDNSAKHPPEIIEELRQEFVDEARENLQALDVLLDAARNGRGEAAEVVTRFRRAALQWRGQAANFGLPALAVVAHRLDDYLAGAPEALPPRTWGDLQTYIDVMTSMIDGGEPAGGEVSTLVRSLPRKLGFDLADIDIRNVEVLLVMPHGAQTRFVERELQQCGYRVSVVPDTMLAFSLVTQTKPDLIIISAVMPTLNGIDLAIGLAAMPATRNIPMAVITSLDPDDDRLALLPRKIPVLYKGASFGDDLFTALDNLFLI
jgi:CheY-like chemotaxis protein